MDEARSQKCERIASWISRRLDGELSELEQVLLHGHLAALRIRLPHVPAERQTRRLRCATLRSSR